MKLVKPSFEIMEVMALSCSTVGPLELIERAGRVCYKSEDRIDSTSAKKFVQKLNRLGHESVIEHSAMTVKFIIDRGVSHELVRHRITSPSQESTRYCNYKGGVTFVIPPWVDIEPREYTFNSSVLCIHSPNWNWYRNMLESERNYKDLLKMEWTPEQARSVLPNSLKTEIVVTANFREWRHIFRLRCSKAAHPQMREIMIPLHEECKRIIPVIFDDIEY